MQLFLTSFVMKRYSVKAALLFLPLAILGGTLGFVPLPTLAFVGFMSVSDNALNYSINQSAKEALYTPTSQDEKYKAKSFIDMFVQRAAKVAAVALNLGLTALVITDVRWLSVAVGVLLVAWIATIRYLGSRYEDRKEGAPAFMGGVATPGRAVRHRPCIRREARGSRCATPAGSSGGRGPAGSACRSTARRPDRPSRRARP